MKKLPSYLFLLCMGCSLSACVEETLKTRQPSDALVRIVYDWPSSDSSRPTAGMKLRLFPYEAAQEAHSYQTTCEGYEGMLPGGDYQLLAYNEDAPGLMLSGTEAYLQAQVEHHPSGQASDSNGELLLQPVGAIYSVAADPMNVQTRHNGVQVFHHPVRLLTAQIHMTIRNLTSYTYTAATARLRGIALNRNLVQHTGNFLQGTGAMDLTGSFESDGQARSATSCLGLFNPDPRGEGTPRYVNTLRLTLTDASGSQTIREIDLSNLLVELLGSSDLSSSLGIYIELHNQTGTDIKTVVAIDAWNDGGSMDWGLR
ncbi:MAG: DUF5119 domain-containing protein [Prevotellaceae bacterium]|jgi:hypothetical protein|nr:DUF5119 domain-containing protein [Prevotellaceae bacterium]